MGKCDNLEEAILRQQNIINTYQYGEDKVIIHPDNYEQEPVEVRLQQQKKYGAVVLGTYVGNAEYIKEGLKLKFEELKIVADKLMDYPNYQGRMLLFRSCYIPKAYHIFRTIAPSYTIEFAQNLEKIKKEILAGLLNIKSKELLENQNDLNSHSVRYQVMNNLIAHGGLGFQLYTEVCYSAYASSLISYAKSEIGIHNNIKNILTDFVNGGNDLNTPEAHHYWYFRVCLDRISPITLPVFPNENPLDVEAKENDAREMFFEQYYNKKINKRTEGTLQSQFTELIAARRNKIITSSNDFQLLTWLTTIQSAEVGSFLLAIPKAHHYMTLDNFRFTTAIRFRYQYRINNFKHGTRCNCCMKDEMVTPDAIGHHFVSGCLKDGFRIGAHNAIAREYNNCLRYSGFWTVLEEKHAFNNYHQEIPNNRRPDITIRNPYRTAKLKQYLDVTITSPFTGVQTGKMEPPKINALPNRELIKKPLRAAEIAFNSKQNKYAPLMLNIPEAEFLPIVFETSGRMHSGAIKLLREAAAKAEEVKKISKNTIYNFFIKRISIAYQRVLADSLNNKVFLLNSHSNITANNISFSDNEILAQTFVH